MGSTQGKIIWAFLGFLGLVAVGAVALKNRGDISNNMAIVTVYTPGQPTSADPLDFDTLNHHVAFRSVTGSLVSQYRVSGTAPVIAESWTSREGDRVWAFKIRKGLTFENGDPITSEAVVRSWQRLGYLIRKRKSQSDLFDHLTGIDGLVSPTAAIPGLSAQGNEVVLKFDRPNPKLLETLSFGLYAVIHTRDFDQISGAWLDPKRVTSASAYRIAKWDDREMLLERRLDFLPSLFHQKPIQRIRLIWDEHEKLSAGLIVGDSSDPSVKGSHKFYGSTPSGIAFTRCLKWKVPSSICASMEGRKAIRSLVYKALREAGIQPVKSFFPLGMKSVSEIEADEDAIPADLNRFSPLKVYYRRKSGNAFFDAVREKLPGVAAAHKLEVVTVDWPVSEYMKALDPNLPNIEADIAVTMTGILVEDPDSDIRFMFRSKEGIRLPDESHGIAKVLDQPSIPSQKVNEELWRQTLIVPMGHFAFGVWAGEPYDISMLNTLQPPIEFQWVGYR